jgi:RimK family alpha-L-glutamate ligase
LRVGIITRNEDSWCGRRLRKAFEDAGSAVCFLTFQDLVTRITGKTTVSSNNLDLISELSALFVRPIGRGSLDEIVFQLDLLHTFSERGIPVVNSPLAIEKAVDKYRALELLGSAGVQVPETVVTENVNEAMEAFKSFGGEAIVKPVFGSRGIGAARISDLDVAERVFRTLRFYKHVIYVQEYVPHGTSDVRAFVIKDQVVAAMRRESKSWKTNVSQGAKPVQLHPSDELVKIVVKASAVLGCEIAGVDVMENDEGFTINEINSQPGWKGLQSTTRVDIAQKLADYVISRAK